MTTPIPAQGAGRIRWHHVDGTVVEWFGYVGTLTACCLFQILKPVTRELSPERFDEWGLCATFPGAEREVRYASSRDKAEAIAELEAGAERWLEELVSSLGAVFAPGEISDDEDGEPLEVKYAAGRRVRFEHPENGYPGEGEEAAAVLTISAVYTIGWADIGQSRTDLNLFADHKPVGRFNSVLFELADDEDGQP